MMDALVVVAAVARAAALTMAVAGAAVVFGRFLATCSGICLTLQESLAPVLSPELVGVPVVGFTIGTFGGFALGTRLLALLERGAVQGRAAADDLARIVARLRLCAPNSFIAGTRVLLADGASKPIQDLRTGARVLSTDPVTVTTSPNHSREWRPRWPGTHRTLRSSTERCPSASIDRFT